MRHSILPPLTLALITLALYVQILGHDFFYHWDDQWVVINSFTENGLSASNLWSVLTTFYHGQYAPMNELSYMVVHSLFGFNATAFHAASLLWHTANVLLVYLFLSRLLPMMKIEVLEGHERATAWLTALIFAVHPVGVEAVAWISASKILVYAFFYLCALTMYLRYVERPSVAGYAALLALFTLSFLGKEQAVVLPLAFLLTDYAVRRQQRPLYLVAEKLPFLALALFFGIVTILSQGQAPSMPNYSIAARMVYACNAFVDYLFRAFIPVNLSYIYPFPTQPGEPLPMALWGYPLAALVVAAFVLALRKSRLVVFCALFFLVHLLVTLHIISLARFTLTADRYCYLALLAPALLTSVGAIKAYSKWRLSSIAGALYIAYLCTYTFIYTQQWTDSDTLKLHMRQVLEQRGDIRKGDAGKIGTKGR